MRRPRIQLRWTVAWLISRAGYAVATWLPTRVWYRLFEPFAALCYHVLMRRQRHALTANLVRVVGREQAPAAAWQVFRNFARYVVDFWQTPKLGPETLRRRIQFDDWPRLDEALGGKNGTIFVTLHLGQAELGAAGMIAFGHPVNVIAETLSYAPMDDFIQGLRRSLGMKIIPAKKAGPGLLRCLNRGEVLAMLFDVVHAGEGVRVQFFGASAEVSSAPARIAARTGARVLTAVLARDCDDPRIIRPVVDYNVAYQPTGDEEADVRALTQAIATSFEGFVQAYADQWFAFRPLWVSPAPATAMKETGIRRRRVGARLPAEGD